MVAARGRYSKEGEGKIKESRLSGQIGASSLFSLVLSIYISLLSRALYERLSSSSSSPVGRSVGHTLTSWSDAAVRLSDKGDARGWRREGRWTGKARSCESGETSKMPKPERIIKGSRLCQDSERGKKKRRKRREEEEKQDGENAWIWVPAPRALRGL